MKFEQSERGRLVAVQGTPSHKGEPIVSYYKDVPSLLDVQAQDPLQHWIELPEKTPALVVMLAALTALFKEALDVVMFHGFDLDFGGSVLVYVWGRGRSLGNVFLSFDGRTVSSGFAEKRPEGPREIFGASFLVLETKPGPNVSSHKVPNTAALQKRHPELIGRFMVACARLLDDSTYTNPSLTGDLVEQDFLMVASNRNQRCFLCKDLTHYESLYSIQEEQGKLCCFDCLSQIGRFLCAGCHEVFFLAQKRERPKSSTYQLAFKDLRHFRLCVACFEAEQEDTQGL